MVGVGRTDFRVRVGWEPIEFARFSESIDQVYVVYKFSLVVTTTLGSTDDRFPKTPKDTNQTTCTTRCTLIPLVFLSFAFGSAVYFSLSASESVLERPSELG